MAVDTKRIAAFPDFGALPAEELNQLAGAMGETEVGPGATVVRVDEYGTAIYLIEAGNADVVDARGEVIATLGPGDAFGEIGLLLTTERTATVVARTPMRLLSLSGQDFDQIRAQVPEAERALRRLGVQRSG
jgi:CRP-like cAMP-binding protein